MLPAKLSDRLHMLQWVLPAAITLLAALYQLGPARYVHDSFGDWSHYALEVFFYGTTGPIVVWLTLRIVRHWVEQVVFNLEAHRSEVAASHHPHGRGHHLRRAAHGGDHAVCGPRPSRTRAEPDPVWPPAIADPVGHRLYYYLPRWLNNLLAAPAHS